MTEHVLHLPLGINANEAENIYDARGVHIAECWAGTELTSDEADFVAGEIVRRVNAHDDLVATVSALLDEWKRQKGLFKVLERDGWMDKKAAEAERLLRRLEGR